MNNGEKNMTADEDYDAGTNNDDDENSSFC
jgi:hypothetical protein